MARGAQFLTPPKQHETEMRCYIRDPDGYLIEVGQTTLARGWRPPSWCVKCTLPQLLGFGAHERCRLNAPNGIPDPDRRLDARPVAAG
jgi:hypothetical protein